MTNEEALNDMLRKTFPRTIFIRGINELNKTQSIVFSDEWLKMPYEAESEELDIRFDISNSSERIVKCVEKYDTPPYSCDYELLEIGKLYTVTNVDVHSWHTMITLKEFPGKEFNSVLFAESEDEG